MTTKVQIYLGSAADALMCARAGADFIGLVADSKKMTRPALAHGETHLSFAEVKAAFATLPKEIMKVALTFETEASDILDTANAIQPDAIHLAGPLIPPETIRELRSGIPTVKIMQAIAMNGPNPIELALRYQSVCDYFLLDTNDESEPLGVGATGQTHDWNLSADLARRVGIPVILAGGLSPDNVSDAVRVVRPWGVDSFSHTNVDGRRDKKDEGKVRAFIANAKSAL